MEDIRGDEKEEDVLYASAIESRSVLRRGPKNCSSVVAQRAMLDSFAL